MLFRSSLITLPAWANSWNAETIQNARFLAPSQDALLAEIVETIIPKTDTPGAKDLGIHVLIQKIVKDCYDMPAQEKMAKAIDAVENLAKKTHNKSFTDCEAAQRLDLLKSMDNSSDAELKGFLKMLKRMTTDGYMKSQYVMENILKYEFAPARFYGCVPVKA